MLGYKLLKLGLYLSFSELAHVFAHAYAQSFGTVSINKKAKFSALALCTLLQFYVSFLQLLFSVHILLVSFLIACTTEDVLYTRI